MKRSVKSILALSILGLVVTTSQANAESIYYTNNYGVNFTKQEYDFYTKMFWDGYQKNVTQEKFDYITSLNLYDKDVERVEVVTPEYMPINPSVTQNLRTLTISKGCSSDCFMSLTVTWLGYPNVRSNDVMGARLQNASLNYIGSLDVYADNYVRTYDNYKKPSSNGFGYTVPVPEAHNMRANVTFRTSTSGIVYGSYQHAMSAISEANSKLFTIGLNGYGKVFNFYGAAANVYDECNGVDIELG